MNNHKSNFRSRDVTHTEPFSEAQEEACRLWERAPRRQYRGSYYVDLTTLGTDMFLAIVIILFGSLICLVLAASYACQCQIRKNKFISRLRRSGKKLPMECHMRQIGATMNGLPDPKTLEEYWVKSFRSPEDTLRFGSLMLDIEAHCRSVPIARNGRVVGRTPGVKSWLLRNAPYIPYQTAMRYKNLARMYRQALGQPPGYPSEWFMPSCPLSAAEINMRAKAFAERLRNDKTLDREAVEQHLSLYHELTDKELADIRNAGLEMFMREDGTEGIEGMTRRLCRKLDIPRKIVGPVRRSTRVLTKLRPVFEPTEFRDRAYHTPRGRHNFAVRCSIRRDNRHIQKRSHVTEVLFDHLPAKLPDARFAQHLSFPRTRLPLPRKFLLLPALNSPDPAGQTYIV